MAYKKKSKKIKRQVDSVIVHVRSTFNNTLVAVTTMEGDVILRGSSGKLGYKGSRKGTPFAASQIASNLAKDMSTMGVKNVEINLQGPGSGRAGRRRAKNKSAQSRAHSPVSRRALTQAEIRRRDVLSIVRRRDGYAHEATFEARVRREPGFAAAYRRGLITRGLDITEAGAEAWALLSARQEAILRDAPPERKKGKRCAAELERKVRRELSKIDS